MADLTKLRKPIPKGLLRTGFVVSFLIVTGLFVAGFWLLMIETPDRAGGFGYITLALVFLMFLGWKVRWLQKLGYLGAPPTP